MNSFISSILPAFAVMNFPTDWRMQWKIIDEKSLMFHKGFHCYGKYYLQCVYDSLTPRYYGMILLAGTCYCGLKDTNS